MPTPSRPAASRLALRLAAAALALAACRGGDAPPPPDAAAAAPAPARAEADAPWPRLGALMVADLVPADRRPVDLALEADVALRRALLAPGVFAGAELEDPGACEVDVQVVYALLVNDEVVMAADAGNAHVALDAEARCPPPPGDADAGDGAVFETFRVSLDDKERFEGGPAAGPAALRALLGRLAPRTADALYGQVVVRHAPDAEILRVLAESDRPGLLMEAASEAGERKLEAGVPALIRLTRSDQDMVALRAGGALGLIGHRDREVLAALAHMTDGPDTERHLVAIHALGDLGGPEAARYLDTLAVGHPLVPIRDAARDAALRARGLPIPDREEAPEPRGARPPDLDEGDGPGGP